MTRSVVTSRRHSRRVSILAVFVAIVVLGAAGTAFAFWTGTFTGNSVSKADTLATGATPGTATKNATNGNNVTITFSRVSTGSGIPIPATNYTIKRYPSAGGAGVISAASCSGTTTISCTINGEQDGSWVYKDTPTFGTQWVGTESGASPAVTVDTVAPTLTSLVMQDTNTNGKIDHVVATFSETLASSTLTTPPWTLANVPSGGTLLSVTTSTNQATLTLTEGAGAADTSVGSFTVALAANANGIRDTFGNQSSFAATAPADGAAPARTAMTMLDTNANGKIDRVTVTFSESLASYTAGTAPWTLANVPSGGSLASVAVATNTATLTLTEGAGAANTAVGTFTVALASNAAGIRDAVGNQSSFAATAPTDGAAPVQTAVTMSESGTANGKIDRVTVTFSETLVSSTATAPWTLANVPSGGSLASVSTGGTATATLVLTEGAGAADTSVGTFTVALATNASGIRDAAGNLSSFAATAPADGAGPVLVSITNGPGTTAGLMQTGNSLALLFSEPLKVASVPTSVPVTELRSGSSTLTMPGLILSASISNNYLGGNGGSGTATGTVALSNGNKTVTVTLGTVTTGGAGLGTGATAVSITPDPAVQDLLNNAAAATSASVNPLF